MDYTSLNIIDKWAEHNLKTPLEPHVIDIIQSYLRYNLTDYKLVPLYTTCHDCNEKYSLWYKSSVCGISFRSCRWCLEDSCTKCFITKDKQQKYRDKCKENIENPYCFLDEYDGYNRICIPCFEEHAGNTDKELSVGKEDYSETYTHGSDSDIYDSE